MISQSHIFLTATVLWLSALSCASALGTRVKDLPGDVEAITSLHNTFRAQHGSDPLVWSEELADTAAAWAKECRWEHSTSEFRSGAGENLYAGVGSPIADSYNAAAIGWYNEIEMYNFDDPGDLSKTTRGFTDIGHFTAMVWRDTDELGCARQTCPPNEHSPFASDDDREWVYVVCHYKESGNRLSAGADEFELFREQVLPVLDDAVPLPPIRSCSSDTVTLDISVTAVGSTCEAADTLVGAIEQLASTLVCRHGWRCSGYESSSMPFTTVLTLDIPETDVVRVSNALRGDTDLLGLVWADAEDATSTISVQEVRVDESVTFPTF